MEPFLIPQWIGVTGGTIAGVVSIVWAAVKAYENGFSNTEKQKDQAAKDLVKILQATVDSLKTEMEELRKAHVENVREISKLSGENETLLKILQGRDEAYIKFQEEGFSAFRRIKDTNDNIKNLINVLDKHLINKK